MQITPNQYSMQQIGFVFKLLVISVALSMLIKYGGSIISIHPTPIKVLTLVFMPTLIMAVALGARYAKFS